MGRVLKTTAESLLLYRSSPSGLPCQPPELHSSAFSGTPPRRSSWRARHRLPHNPFTVQCVIDILKESQHYKHITHVVPDEADAFCAEKARHTTDSLILTGDSDLLIYDTGGSKVVFFDDMDFCDGHRGIRCSVFWPTSISQRLLFQEPSSEGIIARLAFELQKAPRDTLQQLLVACRTPPDKGTFYRFLTPYRSTCHLDIAAPLAVGTPQLDVRLLELVLQCGHGKRIYPFLEQATHQCGIARIFLPNIPENPVRSNCFSPSIRVRQIAYSLLRPGSLGNIQGVQEFTRLQTIEGKGSHVSFLNSEELERSVLRLADDLSFIRLKHDGFFWPAVTFHLENDYAHSNSKRGLAEALVNSQGLGITQVPHMPWDLVHFCAQIQACCYSFRLLEQILSLSLHGKPGKDAQNAHASLQPYLATIPPLRDFPSLGATLDFLHHLQARLIPPRPVANPTQSKTVTEGSAAPTGLLSREEAHVCESNGRKRHSPSLNRFHALGFE